MTSSMRALVLGAGAATVQDRPRQEPGPGEVRVVVTTAGVCATDLALQSGYMDFAGVPGHEFVGVAVGGALDGRRVVGEINAACGSCARCLAGDDRHCASRSVLGILGRSGAFAEELVLPERNLVGVPDNVSNDAATFTEPLAAAMQLTTQVDVNGRSVLVVGDGRLGLLCAYAAQTAGADVTLAGHHQERAALLPEPPLFAGPLDPAASPNARLGAEAFDIVIEATGRADVLEAAIARVRPRGTLVLKTTGADAASVNLWQVVVNELTVVGSRCGRFAPALERLADDAGWVEKMVQHRFPLAQAPDAMAQAGKPGVLKVLIDIPG